MYRQSPSSRTHRSNGIKIKHVLQICLLLAVCFWLIYQVKHSHDKKKEFEQNDENSSHENSDGIIKLGRKDIRPQVEESIIENIKHDEALEEEETEETEEENKHEKDVIEEKSDREEELIDEEKEREETEEEEENKHEKDEKSDREEELVDEEKEREEGDENENEEKDMGDNNGQTDAREELYKADDASSAVTHNTQTENSENETKVEESDKIEGVKQSNVTTVENTFDKSFSNDTGVEPSTDDLEASGGSTEVAMENHNLSLPNGSEFDHGPGNLTSAERSNLPIEQAYNSTLEIDNNHFSESENSTKSENLEEGNDNNNNNTEAENSDEVLESETIENVEGVEHDAIDLSDSSNFLEEKDVRTDLETLPEIQTVGTDSEDAAAE